MGVRNFRFAEGDEVQTGETAKGADPQFLVYQTAQATPVSTVIGGASVGSVKGPQETNNVVVAYANSAVNAAGANGVTYDVEFYGATEASGEAAMLAAINGAIAQFGVDNGGDTSLFGGYPYTSDVDSSGAEVNGVSDASILVIKDNVVLS
tara:strand:- start:53 stop:505 length:453 start_codon:yes stop_codon:yes gene_type:complete